MQVTTKPLKCMPKVPDYIRNYLQFHFYVFQKINIKKKFGLLTRVQYLKECLHHSRFKCTVRRLADILIATGLGGKIMSFTHNRQENHTAWQMVMKVSSPSSLRAIAKTASHMLNLQA